MKNFNRLSILLIVFLFLGCGDNNDNTPDTGDGLLVHLEKALDGVFYEWTNLSYNEDQNLTTIDFQFEGSIGQVYELTFDGTETSSLIHTINYSDTGTQTVKEYEIIQVGDEITLKISGEGDKFLFRVSDGYIDYFKSYHGINNEFFNETVFTRDADNNIEKVEYFATDATSTALKVFEYTYTDHASTFDLPSAHNPVMDFSFTTFNPFLGAVMGLKISNHPPMKSSYWDAGGTFREENIIATPVTENGVLQELSYEDRSTGNDNYLLKLSYN